MDFFKKETQKPKHFRWRQRTSIMDGDRPAYFVHNTYDPIRWRQAHMCARASWVRSGAPSRRSVQCSASAASSTRVLDCHGPSANSWAALFGLPHGFPSTSEEAFGWIYLNPKHSPQNFLFFNQNLVTHKFLASQESLGSFAQYNIPIHLQNHKINRNYMFINYDRYILCYFIHLGSELN